MHCSYVFDYNYTSIHVANISEISNMFPPSSRHGARAAERQREAAQPGAYLLHHAELVRGVVEQGVEGVPLCVGKWRSTGRVYGNVPGRPGDQAVPGLPGCPAPTLPARLESSSLPPEPKGRCGPGAKSRKRCFYVLPLSVSIL